MENMENVMVETKTLITKDHLIGAGAIVAMEAAALGIKKLVPIVKAKLTKQELTEEVEAEEILD